MAQCDYILAEGLMTGRGGGRGEEAQREYK